MVAKVIAIVGLVCVSILYFLGAQRPNDPYFLFVSSNSIVAVGRVALAALLLHLAYQKRFVYAGSRQLCAAIAILLAVFGVASLAYQPLTFALSNTFKPVDCLFTILCGYGFGILAAERRPGNRRLPRLTRPRHPQLRLFLTRHA